MDEKNKVLTKEAQIEDSKTNVSERIALHALQKQLQVLKCKEWLLIFGFIVGAALLRVPMQAIPSAEPISFFALLSGWLFGRKKGFMVGVSALYISNFFTMGGQGIWTIFQALGFGTIGFLGGFIRKKSTVFEILSITALGTIIYEIIVNIGSIAFFPVSIFGIFLSAAPFSMIHLSSNLIFAGFLPKTKSFIEKKGRFDEKEICEELINRFNNKVKSSRLFEKSFNIFKKNLKNWSLKK